MQDYSDDTSNIGSEDDADNELRVNNIIFVLDDEGNRIS